ncbi:class I SAM-dependent methyltransferase [Planomonospora parontospora]|uniref:class I SAM-dependent methyltransferase n=1 Tax=Planomonospora parontospora TaxID=58119 RepID=UPI00166F9157|nr:class I SAM-dependent methyltransferase [Planomonospora parontospora]GGL28558.1 methyltransferase type 11 [Planomonospora parontospora subsp. antibiotica]GII18054.1 methyltransferase type 11 [Planomonospora parontospora subsp. antibiotica]
MPRFVKGAIPSPNIWNTPHVYELENRAVDPEGRAGTAMAAVRPLAGATVLDVGCGTGYHLPALSAEAARVIGVEPHADLVELARRRCRALPGVEVRTGTAQALPLPDASVDVAVARWAYFFGPGCEPGLAELTRVLRRGGTAFVVDVDASRGDFGRWFRRSIPSYSPQAVADFWVRQDWQAQPLDLRMAFERRADLEAVLRIEFTPEVAAQAAAETPGLEIAYPNVLRWKHF